MGGLGSSREALTGQANAKGQDQQDETQARDARNRHAFYRRIRADSFQRFRPSGNHDPMPCALLCSMPWKHVWRMTVAKRYRRARQATGFGSRREHSQCRSWPTAEREAISGSTPDLDRAMQSEPGRMSRPAGDQNAAEM